MRPVTRVVLGVAVVLYLCGTLACIDRFPAVSQDEPRIASSGYKLATAGALGSDLFSGYHGMDQHHFVQMPVYPLLQAAVFRMFGLGVVQMRACPLYLDSRCCSSFMESVGRLAANDSASLPLRSPLCNRSRHQTPSDRLAFCFSIRHG
jgi:hypothetical protein